MKAFLGYGELGRQIQAFLEEEDNENDEVEYLTILKHIVALRNKEEILKQNI